MTLPLRTLVACGAITGLLLGCGVDTSEQDLLKSATSLMEKSDINGARLQLQNVLQKNPSSAPARFLLGKVLAESGQFANAEIELRKAQELNHPRELVAPELARIMLIQQQHQKLVEQFRAVDLADKSADADLKASVVSALTRLGDRKGALALADAVLARTPDHPAMLLAKARLVSGTEGVDAALALVGKVVAAHPDNAEAWHLQGDLQVYGKRDWEAAAVSYEKSLAIRPANVWAQTALVGLHLGRKDIAAAKKQQQSMAKALPTHLQTRYVEAQILFAEDNFAKAREVLQPLIKAAPRDARLLQFAGALEAALASPVQAESYLTKAIAVSPELAPARRLLAQTYLRMGQESKALEVLRPLLAPNTTDVDALTLAAEALLTAGNTKDAEQLFNRAAKLKPDDAKVRTSVAVSLFTKGQAEQALAELQRISASGPDTVADLALISAQLHKNDVAGALRAIDALAVKEPKNPRTYDMRGRVLIRKRDLAGARQNFNQALSLDPAYFPAIASLAALDLGEGKPDEAQKRLEQVIKTDPRHLPGLISLAELALKRNADAEQVAQWLDKAVAAHPTETQPRLMLVDLWLAKGDRKRALNVAQAGVGVLPDHPAMVDALGRAQLAAGEVNQAVATFGKLATLQPNSTLPLLRQADAYRAARNLPAAEQMLKRAIALAPGTLSAQRGLIVLAVRGKRLNEAIEIARQVQRERPNETTGFQLEGNVHVEAKNWDEAIKAYRRGLDKPNGTVVAIQLHTVFSELKRTAEADQFGAEWLKRHANDTLFLFHLGNAALKAKDYATAERRYAEVMRLEPNNAKAVNNVAWLKLQTKQPGAVQLAERAVALAPRNAEMLDTLALALEQDGKRDRAIEAARKALALSPNEPALRLNLARLYVRAGDKTKAREELDVLVKLGDKFSQQAEVQTLLKQL